MRSTWSNLINAQEATTTVLPVNTLLQRKCDCGQHTIAGGEGEECSKKPLQRHAAGQAEPTAVPSIVQEVLRSPGQPLDAQTRAFMELRFGHDFSRVRLHLGAHATESARAVNALAYTSGWNVVFGQGQYNPTTHQGRQLLAHELTHVVQQRGYAGHQKMELGQPGNIYERQADEMALAVIQAPPSPATNKAGILNQPPSSHVARLHRDFGGALRRQHDTTATDPQDTLGTAKRASDSKCPEMFRCKPPYKDRQVCCSLSSGVTGVKTYWNCFRDNPTHPGQISSTQHDTYEEANRVCSKKDK
jgi:uncharacterized protein DUF4157